ncbi:BON domain-containing protein [Archangium sp.]|uniref:BON domain-containing protein n=1 Tax=Archangium sp. TaxID=1872627 RepID=UPI002D41170B|nr:BON domain-containing protein [Archangium sp.]HYO54932.1 BON domain-containing protein [Archangium sp.]
MADRRRHGVEWQGRGQDPERGNRRDVTERGRDMGRVRGYSGEDRGPGCGRDEDRGRGRSGRGGGGGMRGSGFGDQEVGRYGRGYEYGGDEDRGRFDQDSREEYHRGGLVRGTAGHRRAGGPGDEFGEGFWSELTHERARGDFDRYGAPGGQRTQHYDTDRWDRGQYGLGAGDPGQTGGGEDYQRYGWGRGWSQDQGNDYQPPRVQSSYIEQRPRTGYATSPTRDMDREMGHGAGRGGMQGAYPYYEQSPELPRRQGRGPRNYQRSDDRIREDICDRLMQAWMDADDVSIRVEKGEVTLSGTVKSRNEKRAIEDLAEEVLGVKEVHNEIRVAREQREEDRGSQQDRTLHS